MQSNRWHIRLGNETFGPLTSAELNDLAQKGNIDRATQVSADSMHWAAAESIDGLLFRPEPVFPSGPPPVSGVNPQTSSKSKLGSAIFGTVVAVAVLILIGLYSNGREKSASAPPTSMLLDDKAQALTRAGRITFNYWSAVSESLKVVASASTRANTDPAGTASQFRSVAESVEGLPTAGVDADAVKSAMAAATVFKEMADAIEEANDPARAAEAFVKGMYGGWSGDLGPAMSQWDELQSMRRNRVQHVRETQRLAIETRALLSSRYGVEFPPL